MIDLKSPHIRYTFNIANHNPYKKYGYYIGTDMSYSRRDAYEFSMAGYSPDKEADRRDIWVTQNESGD